MAFFQNSLERLLQPLGFMGRFGSLFLALIIWVQPWTLLAQTDGLEFQIDWSDPDSCATLLKRQFLMDASQARKLCLTRPLPEISGETISDCGQDLQADGGFRGHPGLALAYCQIAARTQKSLFRFESCQTRYFLKTGIDPVESGNRCVKSDRPMVLGSCVDYLDGLKLGNLKPEHARLCLDYPELATNPLIRSCVSSFDRVGQLDAAKIRECASHANPLFSDCTSSFPGKDSVCLDPKMDVNKMVCTKTYIQVHPYADPKLAFQKCSERPVPQLISCMQRSSAFADIDADSLCDKGNAEKILGCMESSRRFDSTEKGVNLFYSCSHPETAHLPSCLQAWTKKGLTGAQAFGRCKTESWPDSVALYPSAADSYVTCIEDLGDPEGCLKFMGQPEVIGCARSIYSDLGSKPDSGQSPQYLKWCSANPLPEFQGCMHTMIVDAGMKSLSAAEYHSAGFCGQANASFVAACSVQLHASLSDQDPYDLADSCSGSNNPDFASCVEEKVSRKLGYERAAYACNKKPALDQKSSIRYPTALPKRITNVDVPEPPSIAGVPQ